MLEQPEATAQIVGMFLQIFPAHRIDPACLRRCKSAGGFFSAANSNIRSITSIADDKQRRLPAFKAPFLAGNMVRKSTMVAMAHTSMSVLSMLYFGGYDNAAWITENQK